MCDPLKALESENARLKARLDVFESEVHMAQLYIYRAQGTNYEPIRRKNWALAKKAINRAIYKAPEL